MKAAQAGADIREPGDEVYEFLATRVEALLYRPGEYRSTVLRVGTLELDLIERTARRGDRPLHLLPREFRLLEYLMRREGEMVTRAMLFAEVWNYRFIPDSNSVNVHMGKLRHKVDQPGEPHMIQCVRGAGYVLIATTHDRTAHRPPDSRLGAQP